MSRTALLMVALVATGWLNASAPPPDPVASPRKPAAALVGAHATSAIPGRYIVKVMDGGPGGHTARELASRYHGALGHVWHGAFNGFSVSMSQADATRSEEHTSEL